MNRTFQIRRVKTGSYPCVVFSTGYTSPMDQLDNLERELAQIGISGKILFDLLLSHGNTPDRFYEAFFDGKKLSTDSLIRVKSIPQRLKRISSNFYHEHPHYFENSILPSVQRFLLKRGKIL